MAGIEQQSVQLLDAPADVGQGAGDRRGDPVTVLRDAAGGLGVGQQQPGVRVPEVGTRSRLRRVPPLAYPSRTASRVPSKQGTAAVSSTAVTPEPRASLCR